MVTVSAVWVQIPRLASVEGRIRAQAPELKGYQCMSHEPNGTEKCQSDAEGAVSQSHRCSISVFREGWEPNE